MQRNRLFVVSLLILSVTAPARAQVSARQGDAPAPDIVHFESPMILDLAVRNVAAIEVGGQLQLPDVRKYICDKDVSLRNLAITKTAKTRRDPSSLQLVVSGRVSVADSYDRRVDIALRFKSGDKVIASGYLQNFSTEEGRETSFRITLPITDSALREAYASEVRPTLELVLTVRDDS